MKYVISSFPHHLIQQGIEKAKADRSALMKLKPMEAPAHYKGPLTRRERRAQERRKK